MHEVSGGVSHTTGRHQAVYILLFWFVRQNSLKPENDAKKGAMQMEGGTIRRQATTIHGVCVCQPIRGRWCFSNSKQTGINTWLEKPKSRLHDEPSSVIGTAVVDEDQHRCSWSSAEFGKVWFDPNLSIPETTAPLEQPAAPPSPVAFRSTVPWLWTSGLRSFWEVGAMSELRPVVPLLLDQKEVGKRLEPDAKTVLSAKKWWRGAFTSWWKHYLP